MSLQARELQLHGTGSLSAKVATVHRTALCCLSASGHKEGRQDCRGAALVWSLQRPPARVGMHRHACRGLLDNDNQNCPIQ